MFHQGIYFVVCFNNYCFSFLAFLENDYRGWFHISCNHCLISWVDYSVGTRREKGHSPSCWRCHLWKTLQMYILQLNKHPENNHWALVKKGMKYLNPMNSCPNWEGGTDSQCYFLSPKISVFRASVQQTPNSKIISFL